MPNEQTPVQATPRKAGHAPAQKPRLLHPVGMRTVKTVLAAALVTLVYGLLDRNACFACIGAVYGMGSMVQDGVKTGGNRFVGTAIGGLLAIPFYWLMHLSGLPVPQWVWLSLGLFLILYINGIFGTAGAIQPGTVVFFVLLYTVSADRYISYTLARILDTGIGVLVAVCVNLLLPSARERAIWAEDMRRNDEEEAAAVQARAEAFAAAQQAAAAAEQAAQAARRAVETDNPADAQAAQAAARRAEELADRAEALTARAQAMTEELNHLRPIILR